MASYQSQFVSEDTIFVTGLPEDTTQEQLAEYFGQIGIIKFDKKNECPKIWIYKDKATGKGKGEATVTYDDPPTASSAISWFNGKEFRGSKLTIELAQRKTAPQYGFGGRGGGRGGGPRSDNRGGYDGRGGGGDRGSRGDDGRGRPGPGSGRPGDWLCPSCNNNNFAYRRECNRCQTQKPAGAGGDDSGGGGGSGGGRGGGSHYNGGRHMEHDGSRGGGGGYAPRGRGGSNYRDNDNFRDRGRDNRGDRDRDRDSHSYRDRDRDGNRDWDRDRNRSSAYGGSGGGGGGGGGPSRNQMRGKDDRRSRPY